MAVANPVSRYESIADLLASFGGIPPERVRLHPSPGSATKRDLIRCHNRGNQLYELVEGTLVEKPMGSPESFVGLELAFRLRTHLETHDLGYCTGADDLIELLPKLVRGPDLSFISWRRRPQRTVPSEQISRVVPDLAVEVLSPSNTQAEIERKLKEYFLAGVNSVWIIDPRNRTAEVHTSPEEKNLIPESGTLDGGSVLPGFRLPLAKLFERLEKPKAKKRKK